MLARNDDCALTCIYHGWKIAPDGRVLETPAEPEDSTFYQRVRAQAYPVYEDGGIVWAYLGPAGTEPPRMHFDWMSLPQDHVQIQKVREDCNWVQCLEGVIDSAHSNVLHRNLITPVPGEASVSSDGTYKTLRPSDDTAPRIEAEDTSYGFRYAAIRKPLVDPDKRDYVRVTLFIAPFLSFFPGPVGWTHMQIFVPVDDEHTMFHFVQVKQDGPIDAELLKRREKRSAMQLGIDIDAEYRKVRTRANNWLQDRAARMAGTNFTGMAGVNNEDIAVQESMGPMYDRSREHLGASDIAVIRMRRIMLDGLRAFEAGGPAVGLAAPVAYDTLHAEERMIPKETPWQGELVG